MARGIPVDATPDEMEKEIDATTVAIEVDENAAEFRDATAGWDEPVAELRKGIRENLRRRLRLEMLRQTINRYLDPLCMDVSRTLNQAVRGNREDPRWVQHFEMSPTMFCKQPLDEQVRGVKAWLVLDDPALAGHKVALQKWMTAADALFVAEALDSKANAAVWAFREQVAKALTARRDALHRRLCEAAERLGLDRAWADGFFLRG